MVIIGGVMSTGDEIFGSLYEKGTIIFHQNDPGDAMYIIQSGAVEISHTDENGRKRVLALLEKGDFFGEIALFQDVPRSATVTAIKKTRLLPFTKNSLLKRIQTDPGVALHLMTGLVSYIQWANQKYREMVEADDELRDAVTTAKENGDKPGIIRTDKKLGTDMEALSSFWNVDDQIASFPKGHTIFKEGDPGDSMYIILGGTVEISLGEGDDHQVIAFLGEGDFFGEMAIISGDSRSATVKTLKETRLLPIGRETFTRTISQSPELALYIIGSLTSRLKQHEAFLADPGDSINSMRSTWQPRLKKNRVKIAMMSLSTCAGCSAVLLDQDVLSRIFEYADIVYCPMLMDSPELKEADITLVEGLVRLTEEAEKIEEARAKSKYLVAWGSCAAFGGIPAKANNYELEELIEETYGHAYDAYSYYLSGSGSTRDTNVYQDQGVALMRQAYRLDNFARVDFFIPGCPPSPSLLLNFIAELMGEESGKAKAVVCAECPRKPSKDPVETLATYPTSTIDSTKCFLTAGIFCAGFMTKGGCSAVCTASGLPCWGCRGPSGATLKKMDQSESYDDVLAKGLAKRCKIEYPAARDIVKALKIQGHGLFDFGQNQKRYLPRYR